MSTHPAYFVMYLLALICFGLAAAHLTVPRIDWVAAGLFLATLPTVLALGQA
jgi:hypothetical protein